MLVCWMAWRRMHPDVLCNGCAVVCYDVLYNGCAVLLLQTHAKNGYYDNIKFHRVIKGFMIQVSLPTHPPVRPELL